MFFNLWWKGKNFLLKGKKYKLIILIYSVKQDKTADEGKYFSQFS